MQPQSLYRAAHSEAMAYRAEVVTRLGAAHGESAQAEWNRQHFWLWLADRVVEHALGERNWRELDGRNFSRAAQPKSDLMARVHELQVLRARVRAEPLMPFAEKERLAARIAELANGLLS